MARNDEGALVPARSAEELVDQAPGLKKLGAELDVLQLLNEDSTDITPEDWQMLIAKIYELHNKYNGVIVAHGTDTMAYTATATALAFGKSLNIPIVFTGSQQTMDEAGTDARVNLERSMKVMVESVNSGVTETMVVFSTHVMRAVRTIKTSESRFDAFDSPGFPHIADLTASTTVFSPITMKKHQQTTMKPPLNVFDTGIVGIEAKPGLLPENIRVLAQSKSCTALLIKSLGAGNVPAKKAKYSLIPVIEELVSLGKPVILATKFVGGRTNPEIYLPGRAALKAGAGHAGNMTDVAAEVKLMWLLGQGIRDPKAVSEAMLKSYIGEVD